MRAAPAVVWFRDDLRLADNPALHAAAGAPRLLCIYILDEESDGFRPLGGASRWWLHHSLASLAESLEAIGGRLDLFRGAARPVLAELLRGSGAGQLLFNRRYQKSEDAVDRAVIADAEQAGVTARTFIGSVLHEPGDVVPKTGGSYKVFSAYWRAALARGCEHDPIIAPTHLHAAPRPGAAASLGALELLPKIRWDGGIATVWTPGEPQAMAALSAFTRDTLDRYPESRNELGIDGSSRLSPHLRFGEVSPSQVFAAVDAHEGQRSSANKLKAEIGWRDFNKSLLWHNPNLATKPFRPDFAKFPYAKIAPATLAAWRRGRTGYPIVDAGMRQLWTTGFMHNRVRMVAASFLVKHLLADWRLGEQWFWNTLCDADPANNAVNWQWVAGSGIDPVPYFRIFNPTLQGEKFDPHGLYVRRYVTELAAMPDEWIHKPWQAPEAVLAKAGVTLGRTYAEPIVDHGSARARALAALQRHRAE